MEVRWPEQRNEAGRHESGGGQKAHQQDLEGCVEEPGFPLKGTGEPWRSSEQGKAKVSLVL